MRNTKKRGKYTLFVYPEKPNYFIGVCLEFDLIQEGRTAQETMERIKEASFGYLETVIKKNLSDDLLNRPAPKEYWKKFKAYLEYLKRKYDERRRLMWQEFLQQQIYTPHTLRKLANV